MSCVVVDAEQVVDLHSQMIADAEKHARQVVRVCRVVELK